MFTGIIEEIGIVRGIHAGQNSMRLTIECKKVLEDVRKGDSIAVNGVCLTVSNYTSSQFVADVMPETVKATTLYELKAGSPVNLERAMAANGRFGGHFVSGHVDGVGEVVSIRKHENAIYMDIALATELLNYVIPKGSIAIDGTSLTVFDVTDDTVTISLIPVTQQDSILGQKNRGALVNVECDMLAKYIERFTGRQAMTPKRGVTMETLAANGFLT
ncbi:MAG TPA: riboflavin synthase [Sporosarcina sp.]|nr:riboflavin synthase [Sporosarcina sp.]